MEKDSKSKININVKYNFMKNLENFGVHEMSINEQKAIDGGVVWWIPIIVTAVVFAVVNDWKNFKAGLFGHAPIE
jgi:hypothetical protein